MIKPNELRIGNLLYFGNEPKIKNRLVVVSQIDKESILVLDLGNEMRINLKHTVSCKPIPVTEEWLQKIKITSGHIEILPLSDAPIEYRSTFVEFAYVHQLQNLYFALTGEELNLK